MEFSTEIRDFDPRTRSNPYSQAQALADAEERLAAADAFQTEAEAKAVEAKAAVETAEAAAKAANARAEQAEEEAIHASRSGAEAAKQIDRRRRETAGTAVDQSESRSRGGFLDSDAGVDFRSRRERGKGGMKGEMPSSSDQNYGRRA